MKLNINSGEKMVSVLLALYNPNMIWLKELLNSLEAQTYENVKIYARDDFSLKVDFNDIEKLFLECFKNKKWSLKRNNRNLGSNGTFEILTKEAEGDFFAYCDQDDIWKKEKIKILVDLITKRKSCLVYSDMKVVDKNGKIISNSIRNVERRVFRRGFGLTKYLTSANFITGCTMLVKAETAKKAVPFVKYIFHDYWIAIIASIVGRIDYTDNPLILYRAHDKNQSAMFNNINTKNDYLKERIINNKMLCKDIHKKIIEYKKPDKYFDKNYEKWIKARFSYFKRANLKDFVEILKHINYGRKTTVFELIMPFMPEFIFIKVIKLMRSRNIGG